MQCINELRQMLLTPIKPYSPASEKESIGDTAGEGETKSPPSKTAEKSRQDSGDDEEEERPGSPSSPPNAQPSSSDPGSDLEELLAKDFPHEDLPSLVTRAMGKGMMNIHELGWVWLCGYLSNYSISGSVQPVMASPNLNCWSCSHTHTHTHSHSHSLSSVDAAH